MIRQCFLAGLLAAAVSPVHARALGGDDLAFGIGLVERFGFHDLALSHFGKLRKAGSWHDRATGTLGVGVVKELRAVYWVRPGLDLLEQYRCAR